MLQHNFSGPGAQEFLMSLTPSSLDKIPEMGSSLTVLLNETGGIIDDTIMTKHAADGTKWYVVTNAGRAKEDVAHIGAKLKEWNAAHPAKQVEWETLKDYGLVALQGPKAAEVLATMTQADLPALKFGQSVFAKVGKDRVTCHIARGGYTGEDGFEVSREESRGVESVRECARVQISCEVVICH
jgi:aminomethyltransferase